MNLKSFQDNSDSILINIRNIVLRCDIHQRYIDHLYLHRHRHQRVLKSKPLQEVLDYDAEQLLRNTQQLILEFKVQAYQIVNVYRHDRNDRFLLLECSGGLRLELDKELNGIRDCSMRNYSNMYKHKPDNYYKSTAVKEYLRIHQEISRSFELATRIIRIRQNPS